MKISSKLKIFFVRELKIFFVGLQFLTRFKIVNQDNWTEKDFGESTKFFPAVGAVIGFFGALSVWITTFLTGKDSPYFIGAIGFVVLIILTGGIHCDGLMDSADGLFSGRKREKMLEIMKDSRVGSFGVVSFVLIAMLEISTLTELINRSALLTCAAIYSAPIIGRLMLVVAINSFPYARLNGFGKAFADFSKRQTIYIAVGETIFFLLPLIFLSLNFFVLSIFSVLISLLITIYLGRFATQKLDGLTGDVYGAITIIVEMFVLIIFLFLKRIL